MVAELFKSAELLLLANLNVLTEFFLYRQVWLDTVIALKLN